MKKRQHTYQLDNKFSLTSSFSQRSHRGLNYGLRSSVQNTKDSANHGVIWLDEEPDKLTIEDELSSNDLKTFAFQCIEALANLANFDAGQTIEDVLGELIREELPKYTSLVEEHAAAKHQFEEYKTWSKKFIANVQPLIDKSSGPASEIAQLTDQAVHCVERSMFSKFTMQTIQNRINLLIESIPQYVEETGLGLQLPAPVMQKMANHVKQALAELAQ